MLPILVTSGAEHLVTVHCRSVPVGTATFGAVNAALHLQA